MSYAIGYAHYELAGGHRQVLRWTLLSILIGVGGLALWQRFGGMPLAALTATATTPLLIGTGVLWVLLTTARCSTAVKTDATQKMLQSHRLMPESAASVVSGYLVGPTAAPVAAGGVFALLGFLCHMHAGHDPAAYMVALAMIVACGLALCCLTVWSGLEAGVASGWAWMLIWPIFVGRGALLAWAPGLLLLAAPFAGPTIFRLRSAVGIDWAHFAGMLLYIALAGIFFSAACRRYRREDEPGMSVGHMLALGGLFVGSTLLMLISPDLFQSGFFEGAAADPRAALPLAVLAVTLLAVWPMVAVERRRAHWRKRRLLGDPYAAESRTPLSALAVAGLFWLLVLPLVQVELVAPGWRTTHPDSAGVGGFAALAVAAAWLVLLAGMARLLVRLSRPRLLIWLLIGWILLPVIGGAALHGQRTLEVGMDPLVGLISPAGAIWLAWSETPHWAWIGAGIQAALAAVAWAASTRVPDRAAAPAVRSSEKEAKSSATPGGRGPAVAGASAGR